MSLRTVAQAGRNADLGGGGLRAPEGRGRQNARRLFVLARRDQVRFREAKAGPDRIRATRLRFLEAALCLHRPADFMIIEGRRAVDAGEAGRRPASAWQAAEQDRQRPKVEQLRSDGQSLLRRTARDLLHELDLMPGPDEPETRENLRDLIAAVEARMKYRPPG